MTDKKIALVTGASRGIGRACALELAKAGYDIIVNYAGNQVAADKTVEEIKAIGQDAIAMKFNIADKNEAKEAIDKIMEQFGRIDVLINNAGITRDGLLARMKPEDWEAVINTNLSGAYYVTQPVSKIMMKQRSGSIVNMASIIGIYGNVGQANYAAAKAGIIGFTKALAKELGLRGIRVNAVAPGFIQTDMTKDLNNIEKMQEMIPLKRLGNPEDIAKTVKFLAVDGTYITGQILAVDGGLVV